MEVAEKIVEKQSWIRFREMYMGDFDLFYLILFWVMTYDDDEALSNVVQVTHHVLS